MNGVSALRALLTGVLLVVAASAPASAATNVATVTIVGPGYVSADQGTGCSTATCTITATAAAGVRFTASSTGGAGWTFDHWSGDCSGTNPVCTLDMRAAHAMTAVFRQVATMTLTVARPVGGFIFTSSDGGKTLQCGGGFDNGAGYTTCSASIPTGTAVQLGFIADTGYVGVTWAQDCASAGGAPSCTVTMNAPHTVSAAAGKAATNTVTVTYVGGSGYVSADQGTGCSGSPCTLTATAASGVRLTANSSNAATTPFDHWSGDCSGTSIVCALDMRTAHAVTVNFRQNVTHTLAVVRPKGGFIFTQSDGGRALQCGGTFNGGEGYTNCSSLFPAGTNVTLAFIPDVGNTGVRWGGDCAGAGTAQTCAVTVSADHSVTAQAASVPTPTPVPTATPLPTPIPTPTPIATAKPTDPPIEPQALPPAPDEGLHFRDPVGRRYLVLDGKTRPFTPASLYVKLFGTATPPLRPPPASVGPPIEGVVYLGIVKGRIVLFIDGTQRLVGPVTLQRFGFDRTAVETVPEPAGLQFPNGAPFP